MNINDSDDLIEDLDIDQIEEATPKTKPKTQSKSQQKSMLQSKLSNNNKPDTPSKTPNKSLLTKAEQQAQQSKHSKKHDDTPFEFLHPPLDVSKSLMCIQLCLKFYFQKYKNPPDHPDYDPHTLYIPPSTWKSFTPFEKQFWEIKAEHFDTILFFQKGKFYEVSKFSINTNNLLNANIFFIALRK